VADIFDLVRASKLAVELDDAQTRVLAGVMSARDLADDEVLVAEGHSDDRLYVIVSGAIAVSKREQPKGEWLNLNVLTRGDLVGELAFMDARPHYANLRALGPTTVLVLQRTALEGLLDSHPRVVYNVMRAIFRVVHSILHRLGAQQSELTNYIYKQHGKY
jgi:CRP-like cAMP-binding protein